MDDIDFAKKMEKFFNQSFAIGDRGKAGWDCLTIMSDFFESCGVEFPSEFKGWNSENYPERWERGEGVDVLRDFLHSIGDHVDPNFILPGDVLIFEMDGVVSGGIYLGSGHFQAVDRKHGVLRLPLKFFMSALTDVRRLLPR